MRARLSRSRAGEVGPLQPLEPLEPLPRRRAAGLGRLLLLALLVSLPLASAAAGAAAVRQTSSWGISAIGPTSRTTTAATGCGGALLPKPGGGYWTCTFDDEFTGSTLDTTKWSTWNGVNYNTDPYVCYYDDPSHLWVQGGMLNLAASKLATPQTCATPLGPATSTYGSALVHTIGHFSQTYGRFEARIKFAGGTGLHDDWWLYPEKTYYPGHAEIDIAEPFGALPDDLIWATHITGPNNTDVGPYGWCHLAGWASGFHTYAVEWAPTGLSFIFDGKTCGTVDSWTPMAGYTFPAPLDQPFAMILQTAVDSGKTLPAPTATTVFPAVTQVDYVRVWK